MPHSTLSNNLKICQSKFYISTAPDNQFNIDILSPVTAVTFVNNLVVGSAATLAWGNGVTIRTQGTAAMNISNNTFDKWQNAINYDADLAGNTIKNNLGLNLTNLIYTRQPLPT